METLSTLQLSAYAIMLSSGVIAVAIGLLLIWQGAFDRVNQLLFVWASLTGVQQVVLVLNALSASFSFYTEATSRHMAQLWFMLDISSVAILFFSIVLYAQVGNIKQRRVLQIALWIWFIYLAYDTYFNYHLDPLFVNTQFNPVNGYPVPEIGKFKPPPLAKVLVPLGGMISMMFALPIIAWRKRLEKRVFYATLVLAISFVVGVISVAQYGNLNVITKVLGYAVLAYTILYGNVFDPVRQANLDLKQSKQNLEKAYSDVEQLVFDRTLELESAVAREYILAQELEIALADAVRINKMKSQIIETVSHEFRTPLTKISTSTELLINYYDRLEEAKRDQLKQKIEDSIHYMTRLIENVLLIDTGSQSRATVAPQEMTMETLCRTLERQVAHLFPDESNIVIAYQTPDTRSVTIDTNLIGQMLQQLIDNARKFSPEQDPIYVQLSMRDRTLQLSVTDGGVGIPEADLPHIYDLFYRGNNIDTRRGLGIGLYAVNRIVGELGGLISAESSPDNTTFTVRVPIYASQ